MRSRRRLAVIGVGVLGLLALPGSVAFARPPQSPPRTVFEGPVPRAVCGPGSQPETGLQGLPGSSTSMT